MVSGFIPFMMVAAERAVPHFAGDLQLSSCSRAEMEVR
jgi:hypothetical protein